MIRLIIDISQNVQNIKWVTYYKSLQDLELFSFGSLMKMAV